MIDSEAVSEILSLYKKHGWTLRRVLLSENLQQKLAPKLDELFGEAPIIRSSLDALWFSRISNPNRETWELRHLSPTPFALLCFLEPNMTEPEREQLLRDTETRMREKQ